MLAAWQVLDSFAHSIEYQNLPCHEWGGSDLVRQQCGMHQFGETVVGKTSYNWRRLSDRITLGLYK